MQFDITEIAPDYPQFRVAVLVCTGLRIGEARSPALEARIAEAEAAARERWGGQELSAIPGVAAWRQAYRQFGIKKTSYRSSVERLVKNVLAGASLARINAFVDAYNMVSLAHVMPAGSDDLAAVAGEAGFRYARPGDSFLDMGALDAAGAPLADPPKDGEVVYADAEKVLCRRWNWRQDARSIIRPETRSALVTIQANGVGEPAAAAATLGALLAEECGAWWAVTVLDASTPRVTLATPE